MKKAVVALTILAALALAGCGNARPAESEAPAAAPQVTADVQAPAEDGQTAPSETSEPAAAPDRQDGERFEEVIIMEGMEETVRCEHIRNAALGFEMDYDYESFVRYSEPGRERFLSVWDDPENPENYLEVTASAKDADTAAASIAGELSEEYDLLRDSRELERAGSCIRIEASVIKNTNQMADSLQVVYILPASDGCRVAAAHFSAEAAEGFGRRFAYMVNTLSVIDRDGERTLSDEQALSAIRNYCYAGNPELEGIVNAGEYPVYWELSSGDAREAVVLFRSYTGAQVRYYIDRITGDTYATVFVPGITPGEERTEENLNAWDYVWDEG